jgi:putative intracellular protease/amidase
VATDGFEQSELLDPQKALEDAGAKVDVDCSERAAGSVRFTANVRIIIGAKAKVRRVIEYPRHGQA